MTKRDFFRIIIKLFGLYSLILVVFNYIPANIGYMFRYFQWVALVWVLGLTTFVASIYVFLILKVDRIIDLLKIDKGFDDDQIILGDFTTKKLVKFAILLIGGFLVVDYLPSFLHNSYIAFKEQATDGRLNFIEDVQYKTSYFYREWILQGINILIGFLFLTNYQRLANWLVREENKK